MKLFYLERIKDEGGISGTGKVAEGVVFKNGKCVLSWLTQYSSVAIYDDFSTLKSIHGHDGKTLIKFYEDEK